MAKHWIECEDCGCKTEFSELRDRHFKCGNADCDAVLDKPPTEKMLRYAARLGIEHPEQLTQTELAPLIDARARTLPEQGRFLRSASIDELLLELDRKGFCFPARSLQAASLKELVEEIDRQGLDFLLLHRNAENGDQLWQGTLSVYPSARYRSGDPQTRIMQHALAASDLTPQSPATRAAGHRN